MALTHSGGRLLLILLCYYVLLCTKLTYLTAKAWPFPIGFNNNNFGGGTKNCMRAGDGKLLYYKSWPYANIYTRKKFMDKMIVRAVGKNW